MGSHGSTPVSYLGLPLPVLLPFLCVWVLRLPTPVEEGVVLGC